MNGNFEIVYAKQGRSGDGGTDYGNLTVIVDGPCSKFEELEGFECNSGGRDGRVAFQFSCDPTDGFKVVHEENPDGKIRAWNAIDATLLASALDELASKIDFYKELDFDGIHSEIKRVNRL